VLTRTTLLVATSLSLAFAPAPQPKPRKVKAGLEALQGTWVLTRQECAGVPDKILDTAALIDGPRFRYLDAQRNPVSTFSLALDEGSSPKRFDMKDLDRPTSSLWGVYSVEGDTLTMCYTWQQGERPPDFDGRKPRRILAVYRRLQR
jgi:uncharacterized protein (TIGR03067 family)